MTEIIPFDYGSHRVRAVDMDGEPWFVAVDVCAVLGLTQARNAVSSLDEDDVTTTNVADSRGQLQQTYIVSDPGVLTLIMRSRKPEARAFRRWITREVIPSIRKTGSYSLRPQNYPEALRAMADEAEARELAQQQVAELEPAAGEFHRWQCSEDTVYVVEWAKSLGLSQQEAFTALRSEGVLIRKEHNGTHVNVPKRAWEPYFRLVDEYLPGPRRWAKVPKITAAGQVELAELMIERGWATP